MSVLLVSPVNGMFYFGNLLFTLWFTYINNQKFCIFPQNVVMCLMIFAIIKD